MFEDGLFGGLFDLNNDGKLDPFEQTLEFMAISDLLEEDTSPDNDPFDSDNFDF